jgi:hypothetical protein
LGKEIELIPYLFNLKLFLNQNQCSLASIFNLDLLISDYLKELVGPTIL